MDNNSYLLLTKEHIYFFSTHAKCFIKSGLTGKPEISDIGRYRQATSIQTHGLLDAHSSSLSDDQKPAISEQVVDISRKLMDDVSTIDYFGSLEHLLTMRNVYLKESSRYDEDDFLKERSSWSQDFKDKLLSFIWDEFNDIILDQESENFEENVNKALDRLWKDISIDNRYFAHSRIKISKEQIESLYQSQDWHGVIYKVTRHHDEFGNELLIPEVYIGQTTDIINSRWNNEISKARRGDYGEAEFYHKTLAKHLQPGVKCDIKDAFDFEIIDLCYSQGELDLKETFWCDFYDSTNREYGGLNYYRGPPFWGLETKALPREELLKNILQGYEYEDLQGQFKRGETTIRKTLGRSILAILTKIPTILKRSSTFLMNLEADILSRAENSAGVREAAFVLLSLELYDLIKKGCNAYEILDILKSKDINIIHKKYSQKSLRRGLNYFCQKIWNKNFDECREDFFIKPLIEKLKSEDLNFIFGEGVEKIDPAEIVYLLDRRLVERFVIGEGTEEWGIIEHLAISGLSYQEMAYALELCSKDDPLTLRRKMLGAVRYYAGHRWGQTFSSINDFVNFLKSKFLGSK